MNKIEKQILRNQVSIMNQLVRLARRNNLENISTEKNIIDTRKILYLEKEQSINEQTKDSLCILNESKNITLPKHGEIWVKEPCSKGDCSCGWSVGTGAYVINTKTSNFDWGTKEQLECGCLRKIGDANCVEDVA